MSSPVYFDLSVLRRRGSHEMMELLSWLAMGSSEAAVEGRSPGVASYSIRSVNLRYVQDLHPREVQGHVGRLVHGFVNEAIPEQFRLGKLVRVVRGNRILPDRYDWTFYVRHWQSARTHIIFSHQLLGNAVVVKTAKQDLPAYSVSRYASAQGPSGVLQRYAVRMRAALQLRAIAHMLEFHDQPTPQMEQLMTAAAQCLDATEAEAAPAEAEAAQAVGRRLLVV